MVMALTEDLRRLERSRPVSHPLLLAERVVSVGVSDDGAPLHAAGMGIEVGSHQTRSRQRAGVEEDQQRGGGQPRTGVTCRRDTESLVLMKAVFQPQPCGERKRYLGGAVG